MKLSDLSVSKLEGLLNVLEQSLSLSKYFQSLDVLNEIKARNVNHVEAFWEEGDEQNCTIIYSSQHFVKKINQVLDHADYGVKIVFVESFDNSLSGNFTMEDF